MSIYDINYGLAWSNLLPLTKRKTKMLAWGIALLKPLQWLRDLIFGDYANGNNYGYWDSMTGYVQGTRTVGLDKKIYECINPLGAAGNSQSPSNPNYWLEVCPNFIGLRERAKYNSQIIVLEYALNKWYMVGTSDPQIYINNINVANGFLMGQTGQYSSKMANNGNFATTFMGNSFTAVQYDFTVYVPVLLFATLGTNALNRENNVRAFVDKYKLVGLTYNVLTF